MVLGEDYYLEILNSHRTVIVSGINSPVKLPDSRPVASTFCGQARKWAWLHMATPIIPQVESHQASMAKCSIFGLIIV